MVIPSIDRIGSKDPSNAFGEALELVEFLLPDVPVLLPEVALAEADPDGAVLVGEAAAEMLDPGDGGAMTDVGQ